MNEPNPAPVLTPEQEVAASFMCLIANLRRAKATEEQAKSNRIKLEEMVAALIPNKEIGQVTRTASDGTKVTVKRGFNYRANCLGIQEVFAGRGSELMAPIEAKTTRGLDVKGYEWYRTNHPEIFTQIAQHVTVTPKKVAVSLH